MIEDLIIKEIQPNIAFIKIDAEPKLKDELFPRLKKNNCIFLKIFFCNFLNVPENSVWNLILWL